MKIHGQPPRQQLRCALRGVMQLSSRWRLSLRSVRQRVNPVLARGDLLIFSDFRLELYNWTMYITIDTSALLAVCTNEAQKTRMVELTAGARLFAPVSVHSEVGNALSAMLKRERITLAQALACLAAYQQIPVKWLEVDLPKALTLAHQLNLYAYDAYLLACAQSTRSHLLTLDKALIRAAREVGVQTLEVYV